MPLTIYADRVKETSTTTGTGPLTLAGAVTGYRTFAAIGNAQRTVILIEAVDVAGRATGEWEICASVYTSSGTTVSRGSLRSSSTGARVSFSAGTKRVSVTHDTIAVRRLGYYDFVSDFDADPTGVTDMTTLLTTALADIVTAGGGELYIPAGIYLFSGALQDTGAGGANAQVPFPQIDGANPSTTAQRSLIIRGAGPGPTSGESSEVPAGMTILKTTLGSGSGTRPSFMASQDTERNNLHVRLKDLVFQAPGAPPLTCLNLGMQQDVILEDLLIHTGSMDISNITQPTGSTYGVIFPQVNKCTLVKADGIMVWGFPTGYKLGELLQGGRFNAEGCVVGMEVPAAYHANHLSCFGAFECAYPIRASGGDSYLMIDVLDIENANGQYDAWQDDVYHVDDASNRIHGRFNWHVVDAGGAGVVHTFVKNSATNFVGTEI